ncbi:MAG: hypothetical protein IJ172_04390 [Ruminococcus sp.]|nr:hypothetical protein [Ruminococcus sp.]
MNRKRFAADAALAAFLSITFVSSIFIFIVCSDNLMPLGLLALVLSAVLVGACFVSIKPADWLVKAGLSLPLILLVFIFFWKTNFAQRAYHWVNPYGSEAAESGASKSAKGMLLLVYLLACGIGALIGLTSCTSEKVREYDENKVVKMQLRVGLAAALIFAAIIVVLQLVIPT